MVGLVILGGDRMVDFWMFWETHYSRLTFIIKWLFIAGLPNTFGGYDETPEMTAEQLKVRNKICTVYITYLIN